ncbi:unnamed protein product [Gulo gulo]|uniref:Uncharacterized protein n=1 Tax=Gulo gulo TaxID=48420 RepID=A0A9X9PU91_GULGU|nr:unnamed protein product [Gulo gulo]
MKGESACGAFRTCLEMTTIRMASKCSTPPTITAKTCFSRMPRSGWWLLGRKPPTGTGWAPPMWRLWKACCPSSAQVQRPWTPSPGCPCCCCRCSCWASRLASCSPPSEAAPGKPSPSSEWKPTPKCL